MKSELASLAKQLSDLGIDFKDPGFIDYATNVQDLIDEDEDCTWGDDRFNLHLNVN